MPTEAGLDDATPARISLVAVLVAVVLCVLVGMPRFAMARDVDPHLVGLSERTDGSWDLSYDEPLDRDIGALSFDVYEYHAYVEYFRGDFDRYPIYGPWRWRLVPSWIAAKTPIENPAVAFAAVTMAMLAAGAAALVAATARAGLGARAQLIAGCLYSVSFPMLWYGTSGYADGAVVAVMCAALYLVHTRRWWLFVALIPIGMLTKETFLIIVPVAGTYLWVRARSTRDWLPWTAASAVVAAGTFFGIRAVLTTPKTLGWVPSYSRFGWNISRPEAVGSFVLTCGVVIPAALWLGWLLFGSRGDSDGGAREWRRRLHLIVGVGFGLAVSLHGFLTAYADGRHAWTVYPFGTLLAALLIDRWLDARGSGTPLPTVATADALENDEH